MFAGGQTPGRGRLGTRFQHRHWVSFYNRQCPSGHRKAIPTAAHQGLFSQQESSLLLTPEKEATPTPGSTPTSPTPSCRETQARAPGLGGRLLLERTLKVWSLLTRTSPILPCVIWYCCHSPVLHQRRARTVRLKRYLGSGNQTAQGLSSPARAHGSVGGCQQLRLGPQPRVEAGTLQSGSTATKG